MKGAKTASNNFLVLCFSVYNSGEIPRTAAPQHAGRGCATWCNLLTVRHKMDSRQLEHVWSEVETSMQGKERTQRLLDQKQQEEW